MGTSWCSASSKRLATLIIHGPCLAVRGYDLPRMASIDPASTRDDPTEPSVSSNARKEAGRARQNAKHERYRTTDSILKVSDLVNDDPLEGSCFERSRTRNWNERSESRAGC